MYNGIRDVISSITLAVTEMGKPLDTVSSQLSGGKKQKTALTSVMDEAKASLKSTQKSMDSYINFVGSATDKTELLKKTLKGISTEVKQFMDVFKSDKLLVDTLSDANMTKIVDATTKKLGKMTVGIK